MDTPHTLDAPLPSTTHGEAELTQAERSRLQCLELVGRLPDEGLAETIKFLVGVIEFYKLPHEAPKPPRQTPLTGGRVVGSIRAPFHPISEDWPRAPSRSHLSCVARCCPNLLTSRGDPDKSRSLSGESQFDSIGTARHDSG